MPPPSEQEPVETQAANKSRNDDKTFLYQPITTDQRAQLGRLASVMSTSTTKVLSNEEGRLEKLDTLEGVDTGHPALNPQSDQFDVYKWVKFLLRSQYEEGVKWRRAGFVFKNLNVSGSGSALNLQKNVGSLLMAPFRASEYLGTRKQPEKHILRNFDGCVKSEEMLIVLGRPGSGCSTFLKTLCGELKGLNMDKNSTLHYNGVSQQQMMKEFRGEVVYNQEVDKHFPHLTVGQTLEFAAASRTPQNRVKQVSREVWAKHFTQVVMTTFGLTHTYNTKVGDDFVRGVSGGERKRVSISEMMIAGAPIACWDNSTRGLDAATALEFVKSLRLASDIGGSAHAVAIYQASQAIYDVFDKVIVLYEGCEIYFGPCKKAQQYFEDMGWYNPPRQTSADFLTSITNPRERKPRAGMEKIVPRTAEEFESYWRKSNAYVELQQGITSHEQDYPVGGHVAQDFAESKAQMQAKHIRPESPYIVSIPMQVRMCTRRAYQRIWNDVSSTVATFVGQIVMALIIGSVYYGTPVATGGFFARGSALFFAVLLNALLSISEINALYDQRPIVAKQTSYAFYHPFAEAFGGIVSDIPVKFIGAVCFNLILYFLAGLRREPAQFFIYFLIVFISTLCMSAIFRTLGAATRTVSQAMALSGVMVLAIVIYAGYTVPRPQMHPWFEWISYINPVFYAFEAIIANEFHGRNFACSNVVPPDPLSSGTSFICSVAGAVAGQETVLGDAFIETSYTYSYSHVWRNFGIIVAFLMFFEALYLVVTEFNTSTGSSAEFLVFRRGHVPIHMKSLDKIDDTEDSSAQASAAAQQKSEQAEGDVKAVPAQKSTFTWRDLTYDIPTKDEERRLLDSVSGWVKPGTLTALMGVSGAGKTTLLDVLAHRTSIGVITGDMLVNGAPLDPSFQRKTGYVQQQDLHVSEATVREALRFSAMLRQPKSVSNQEKYDYVEDVIKMISMEDFAEAVVGKPGEGLNVEQRKLLSIGVELAAKPALLLFLDEPTSGLDSQSSWAICSFLRKLADNGQAVLSTIHQPSAVLFQEFDRLLFLAKGGKTVYFGDIGQNSRTLLEYFETNGARHCGQSENPAEFMLEIIGAGATGKSTQDWAEVWRNSQEAKGVQSELDRIHMDKKEHPPTRETGIEDQSEYAMPFVSQLWHVTVRVFQQYWRMPSYIYGKLLLGFASALFIGFSFYRVNYSQQGLQDAIFSVFMITTIFSTLVQQIMPRFVEQRSLFEVRERPSKVFGPCAFLVSIVLVEIPYQIMMGITCWASYYFATYGPIQSGERQGLVLLFMMQFFVFASTFAHLVIAALPDAETAGSVATILFSLSLTFNGVMQPPSALPKFWIFLYRVSPFTYLVSGITGTVLHGREINCAARELSVFDPPSGQSCSQYLETYLQVAPGRLYNPDATLGCEYCPYSNADQFLASSNIYWDQRWRNYGIGFAYIFFNIAGATVLYYGFRVKHWSPSKIVTGLQNAGRIVGRLFRRRSGKKPEGKAAENNKIY